MKRRKFTSRLKNYKTYIIFCCVILLYLCFPISFSIFDADRILGNIPQEAQHRDHNVSGNLYNVQRQSKTKTIKSNPSKSEAEIIRDMARKVSNWPADFIMNRRPSQNNYNESCARLPSFFTLRMNNLYWQHVTLKEHGVNIYLYGAYLDNRQFHRSKGSEWNGNYVRLLGVIDSFLTNESTMPRSLCQFWNEMKRQPTFSGQADYKMLWHQEWGYKADRNLIPVLISCELDRGEEPPTVVSLVESSCENASNALTVLHSHTNYNNMSKSDKIAVCVKGLLYPYDDRSVRLVEWLELLKLLGADKVMMYELLVHPNISKVLNHYVDNGFVDVTKLTLPGDQFNGDGFLYLFLKKRGLSKRQNEVIPYNDCLYRSLNRFKYVVLLDTDEVIVPTRYDVYGWKDMLKLTSASQNGSNEFSAICARNCFFFENVTSTYENDASIEAPSYMHMLNHLYRSHNYSPEGHFAKCFHSTSHVVGLHNHLPIHCISNHCSTRHLDTAVGHLQHYRNTCSVGLESDCSPQFMKLIVRDESILKYQTELVNNVKSVISKLGLSH